MSTERPVPADSPVGRVGALWAAVGRRLWVALVVFVFGLALLLSAIHERWAAVSLNASAEHVDVTIAAPTVINELSFADVRLLSRAQLTLPNGIRVTCDGVRISPPSVSSDLGSPVTLAPVPLDTGTNFAVDADEAESRYRLTFYTPSLRLDFLIPPGSAVTPTDFPVYQNKSSLPERIRVDVMAEQAVVSAVQRRARQRWAEALPIRRLRFWRAADDREPGARLSTIRSGILVLEDVNGKQLEFRDGEPFSAGSLDGTLRSLAVADGRVQVQFDGRARALTSGYGAHSRTLMPTWLAWLVNVDWIRVVLALLAVVIGSSIPFEQEPKR